MSNGHGNLSEVLNVRMNFEGLLSANSFFFFLNCIILLLKYTKFWMKHLHCALTVFRLLCETHSIFSILFVASSILLLKQINIFQDWSTILSLRPRTVFMSFGTFARAFAMPDEYKETIRQTARALPDVTFIWKYEVSKQRW